jgi:tRNA dimethylallyltransferase
MNPEVFGNAAILTGPTGCGKTILGIELAERLGAEIISMDSMALYQRMDIGTAKPTAAQRQRVPHHLVDLLEPWESASVAWWLKEAARCVADIEGRGKRALFVGGTPLYLKALLRGLFDGPPADPELRQRLSQEATAVDGHLVLHQRLAAIDPTTAARLHPNDLRRIIRALEVWELTGRPISAWQKEWSEDRGSRISRSGSSLEDPETLVTASASSSSILYPPSSILSFRCLWLNLPRAELYARINKRVEGMLAAGLVEEVLALKKLPHPVSREATQALGYKEIFASLDGRCSLAEATRAIQTRSRNFAKRQLTWFRRLPECRPITPELTFAPWGLTMNG